MPQDVTAYAATRRILASNLRHLRRLRGWSQTQLANQCGFHRTYIGALERGERNLGLDNLERLARALDTTAAQMLEDSCACAASCQVREAMAGYRASPPGCAQPPQRTRLRTAVYLHQFATYSLSTHLANFLVMDAHESKCKEATGATCSPVAHQPRLVAGSAGRTQRA